MIYGTQPEKTKPYQCLPTLNPVVVSQRVIKVYNKEDQLTNSISMITHGISLMSPHLQNEFCVRRMKSEEDAKANLL